MLAAALAEVVRVKHPDGHEVEWPKRVMILVYGVGPNAVWGPEAGQVWIGKGAFWFVALFQHFQKFMSFKWTKQTIQIKQKTCGVDNIHWCNIKLNLVDCQTVKYNMLAICLSNVHALLAVECPSTDWHQQVRRGEPELLWRNPREGLQAVGLGTSSWPDDAQMAARSPTHIWLIFEQLKMSSDVTQMLFDIATSPLYIWGRTGRARGRAARRVATAMNVASMTWWWWMCSRTNALSRRCLLCSASRRSSWGPEF